MMIYASVRIALMVNKLHSAWNYISTLKYKISWRSIDICVITFGSLSLWWSMDLDALLWWSLGCKINEIIYPHIKKWKNNNKWRSIHICMIAFGYLSLVMIHGSGRIALMINGMYIVWHYNPHRNIWTNYDLFIFACSYLDVSHI